MPKQYQISFVCGENDMPTLVGLLSKEVRRLSVTQVEAPLQYASPTAKIPPVTKLREKTHRVPGGGKAAQSKPGRLILGVFTQTAIAHGPDFADALKNGGYAHSGWGATINRLMREGDVVRVGRGAYRLPTPSEALEAIDKRKQQLQVS